ncbi:MAG: hypothetical protein ACWGMZ_04645 [Thermoguttaceae bacterium]
MSSNFDPTADFSLIADQTETVTLFRRRITPGDAGTTINHALRRAVNVAELAASNRNEVRRYINTDGQCLATDVNWHLPTDGLAEPPAIGDVILDGDGRRWTILSLQLIMLRTRWRCFSRDLRVAYGLDDTINILQAEYTKGEGGASEPTWRIWRTGVRARIQPVEVEVDVEHYARQVVESFRIYVQDDLLLDHTYRIQNAQGTVFQITAITGAQRLGELQTIEVVKV